MIEQLVDGTIEASFPLVAAAAAVFTLATTLYFFERLRTGQSSKD
jgi:hypothetical protein